ncbi:MAG: hypothetical protein AXA67_02680 [Methylothermaceae bacteria B42]|nr:MAG: hypothetical protein AXA67_02680 [Methylothermaceae bacteria B42]HHJ38070.1 UDP-N-acetylmuramoyl-tripeptide--D-alanyl-D-alanine ligase [Methylothermaceae bacterium]
MRLSHIAKPLQGKMLGTDAEFDGVATDTRQPMPGKLFIALQGPRFDGHDYLAQAQAQGAAAALVSKPVPGHLPQLQVADTRLGLGRLAKWWREHHFSGTLIGVTGSNGKTTVKEMLFSVLGGEPSVLKTAGNFNNDIGVPLTLLRLSPRHRFAVIEMGANHAGEIAYCAGLAKPDIALITNAGPAHLEGFGSIEGVAKAKGELISSLPNSGIAVLNADDHYFPYWKELAGSRGVVSFGRDKPAQVRALSVAPLEFSQGRFHNRFVAEIMGERLGLELPLAGQHNVSNALAVIAVAKAAGIEDDQIRTGLAEITPFPGRLHPLKGKRESWLLDDSYNANPASFEAGLEALSALSGEPWVILGAFGELGPDSETWHAKAGGAAKARGIRRLFAVGEPCQAAVKAFGGGGQYFDCQEALAETVAAQLHPKARILIKGSRSQHLERTVEALKA